MAFKGDLKNVQLADLFQTLSQNRQQGVLTISADGESQKIHFGERGISLLEPKAAGRRRLGEILISSGLISEEQLEAALREQARSKQFLGEILIQQHAISESQLHSILQLQMEEEMYDLFRIDGGLFEFNEGESPASPVTNVVPFHVDGIVLEAARRLDEWGIIAQQIPDPARILVPVEPLTCVPDEEEELVLSHLNGERSVLDIGDSLLCSPFAVAKTLARLMDKGAVRESTCAEVLEGAKKCLAEGRKRHALNLLKQLRDLDEHEQYQHELASMFKQAGDGQSAASARMKIAKSARADGDLEEARRQLEMARREWPTSTHVLARVVELLQEMGDVDAEIGYLRELATQYAENGDPEAAVRCLERVLKLRPRDGEGRRRIVEYCLRARLKEKAAEILEDEAREARKDGRTGDVIEAYKRILSIDATRKDIRRALSRVRRTKVQRLARAGAVLALVFGVGGGAFLYLKRQEDRSAGLNEVSEAASLLAEGNLTGARTKLQFAMTAYPLTEVVDSATTILARVNERLGEQERKVKDEQGRELDDRLRAIQQHLDQSEYDRSIELGVNLLMAHAQDRELRSRIEIRLRAASQSITSLLNEDINLANSYTRPAHDGEVEPTYLRLQTAFPTAKAGGLRRLRQVAQEGLLTLSGEAQETLNQLVVTAQLWQDSYQQMQPEIHMLARQHTRLRELDSLSIDFTEALRATRSGEFVHARDLLRTVLDTYGQGELQPLLSEKLSQLEELLLGYERIEAHLRSHEFEKAHQLAMQMIDKFAGIQLERHLKIPVWVKSYPPGARVIHEGREIARTPAVVRARVGQPSNLQIAAEPFDTFELQLHAENQGIQEIYLQRRHRLRVQLPGAFETRPVTYQGHVFVASRDGVLHWVNAANGALNTPYRTGSLSGSIVPPVPTPEGILLAVLEGKLWMLQPDGSRIQEVWQASIGENIQHAPMLHGDDVLVVGDLGNVYALRRSDGKHLWTFKGPEGKVLAHPTLDGDLLYLATAGQEPRLTVVDVTGPRMVLQKETLEDYIGALFVTPLGLVATTSSRLLLIEPASGETVWETSIRSISGTPALHGLYLDLPFGNSITRVNLSSRLVERTWANLPVAGSPAIEGENLLIGGTDGMLYGLDTGSTEVVFRTPISMRRLLDSPVVSELGVVVLGADGVLQILDPAGSSVAPIPQR